MGTRIENIKITKVVDGNTILLKKLFLAPKKLTENFYKLHIKKS